MKTCRLYAAYLAHHSDFAIGVVPSIPRQGRPLSASATQKPMRTKRAHAATQTLVVNPLLPSLFPGALLPLRADASRFLLFQLSRSHTLTP